MAPAWQVIASSTNPQNGGAGQTPTEYASVMTSGSATALRLRGQARRAAAATSTSRSLRRRWHRLDELVTARSLANLADAPAAMTVAALDVDAPYPQESYSSEGPTNGPGGTASRGRDQARHRRVRQRFDGELP